MSDQNQSQAPSRDETPPKPSLKQIVLSVLAAALGVNSDKNRRKDFASPSPTPYIIGGIIFGVIFCLAIALVVAVVLRFA